jgi:Peptidase family S41
MKKGIFTLLLIIITIFSFSQNESKCEQSLNLLIKKVESEYPGFKEKTEDTIRYSDFKDRLVIKSQNTEDSDCSDLLKYYLSYFRDSHMWLYLVHTNDNETQTPKTDEISVANADIILDDFYKYITESKDELEGVWESTYYKVGILKVNNEYQGFIIEASNESWKANEIKFRLLQEGKANYYMGDHSLREDNFELFDESILSFKNTNAVFIKKSPKPKLTENEIELKLDKIKGFYFTKLTNKTSLLCISSFDDAYVAKIEKIVSDNQQAIENCENLIIDIRNNGGGTYDAYDEILPYIITNNIRGVSSEFLVTQTLIDEVEDWFDDEEGKKMARSWIRMFEGNIGKFINIDSADVNISDIKIAKHSPKQIAVLVNKMTGSSGEAFTLEAKQSKKVKILGTPTYGVIDYGSASLFDFGCENYKLVMPTWRSMRLPEYPLDNIGVQPDIYLDKSVKDWIKYTVDYLEN